MRWSGWRDTRLLLLTGAITGLFLLDLQVPREVPLLPYFWLPVLLASSFATPLQVTALNVVAFGFSIASGIHFRYYTEPDYWARLLFLAGVSVLAVALSGQRIRSQRQLQVNEERYRLLAENASDVVFRIDPQGQLEWISSSVKPLLGWKASELIGKPILSFIHPEDIQTVEQSWSACTSSTIQRIHYRIINRQGRHRWVAVTCRSLKNSQGQLVGRIGSWSDAHDEIKAQEQLIQQRQLLETILDNVDSYVYMKDSSHRYLYANRQVQQLYGRSLADIVGRSDKEFFSAEVLESLWNFDEQVIRSGQPLQKEELVPSANGELRWFLSNKLVLERNGDRQLIGFSTDITDRQRAELELQGSERKFRLLFESSLDATMLVSPTGQFIDANVATLTLFGAESKDDFLRCSPQDFSPEFQSNGQASAALIPANITRALERGSHQFEWLHRRLDNGEHFLALVTLKAITLNDEEALLAVVRDISETRRYEERLQKLAYQDGLTGLPNRAASLEYLERLLQGSGSDEDIKTVLVNLDFDGFQAVNDTFGLKVGDRLLTAASEILRQWLQPDDWLARLESDEFLVIRRVSQGLSSSAMQFGRELQEVLARELLAHPELPIHPSTSIGVSVAPDHGVEPVALLQAANTALMDAKRRSKGSLRLYGPSLSAEIQRRLDLESLLMRAIDRDQLHLLFQPQVDRDGQVIGAEALLRWTLSDGRSITPDEFIPLAEQSGQMHAIGEWVIEEACSQVAAWQRQGLNQPRLAINLSAVQFERNEIGLDVFLMETIRRYGVSPNQLELEVTETALLKSPKRASDQLARLGMAGFRIAIDDFGTGYSSLVNLHSLPVHKLKIDKSFVERILDTDTDRAIVDSTHVIARKLGLETMAEGVETEAQWQALKDLGCDSFQGYLFGKPMPAGDLAELLRGGPISRELS